MYPHDSFSRLIKALVMTIFLGLMLFSPLPGLIIGTVTSLLNDVSGTKTVSQDSSSLYDNGLVGALLSGDNSKESTVDKSSENTADNSSSMPSPAAASASVKVQAEESTANANPDASSNLLSKLLIPLGTVGAAAVALFAAKSASSQKSKRAARKAEAQKEKGTILKRFEYSRTLHSEVANKYSSYLFDLMENLKLPALKDPSIAATADFIEQFTLMGTPPDSPEELRFSLSDYEQQAAKLSRLWEAAYLNASRMGLSALAPEHQKKLVRAQDLLRMALDPASSEFERSSAYQQVRKLMEGLLDIPEAAYAAIETRIYPAIEAAPEPLSAQGVLG